jgi:hypothetical protein
MMDPPILLAVVVIVLAAIAGMLKSARRQPAAYPYTKNKALFSPAERSFLGVLDQAVGGDYRVFGKIRIADVTAVKRMSDSRARQRAFNRISAKHFDFVLCARDDLSIVAAIELDDQSHQQRKRQVRDDFVVGLCHAIGLPLVQVPAQRAYSVAELRAKVSAAIGGLQAPALESVTPSPSACPEAVVAPEPLPEGAQPVTAPDPVTASGPPACPQCSSPMVRRQAKTGAMAGQEFWGCSTFPKCRGIIPAPLTQARTDNPKGSLPFPEFLSPR